MDNQAVEFGISMIPKWVNIVVPLYNQADYVRQCLDSALAQTHGYFDVTVVNDGSTDDWESVRNEYGSRIRWINQFNQGLAEARNTGILTSNGEFILPLDSDDWIDPTYLEKTVSKMVDPKVGVVSTVMQYEGLRRLQIPPKGLTLAHEMAYNDIPVCSLIRRSAFEQTPGYQTVVIEANGKKVYGFEDWNLWIHLLKRGWQVGVVNEPLFHYRLKETSMVTEASRHRAQLTQRVRSFHPDIWDNR